MARALAHYREPNHLRSIVEIAISILPFLCLWTIMCFALDLGYWLCLLLAIPAAGFLVRLFMIRSTMNTRLLSSPQRSITNSKGETMPASQ